MPIRMPSHGLKEIRNNNRNFLLGLHIGYVMFNWGVSHIPSLLTDFLFVIFFGS